MEYQNNLNDQDNQDNSNSPNDGVVHKRRVRYKGTHPRAFHEKYKEANPEKYADTIEKVIRKGSTPAGMHISIMVDEILEFLDIQPGQIGLDATLGYGGHSRRMLEKLEGKGHLYATDVDPIESEKTRERLAALGFRTAAMALSDHAISIDDPRLAAEDRLAVILGTEGDGLAPATIAACHYTVRIPMSHGVDSLNVAAASAVALWQLRRK